MRSRPELRIPPSSDVAEAVLGSLESHKRSPSRQGCQSVPQPSGGSGLDGHDLIRDAPKIRSADVGLRAERIRDVARSRDEGGGAPRTEGADDIPRARRRAGGDRQEAQASLRPTGRPRRLV